LNNGYIKTGNFFPILNRGFWWNGNDENGNGTGNRNGGVNKDDVKKINDKKKVENDDKTMKKNVSNVTKADVSHQHLRSSRESSSFSTDGENGSFNASSTTTTANTLLPTRLGIGDEAPRYPNLTALPVITRPIFPGILGSITITNPDTIDALEKISKNNESGTGGYIGVFLRKKSSMSEGGVIIEQPEVITDSSQLYSVGTFAQIQRFTKNLGAHTSQEEDSDCVGENDVLGGGHSPTGTMSNGCSVGGSISANILFLAHRRIDLLSVNKLGPPIESTCSHWERLFYEKSEESDSNNNNDTMRALSNEILSTLREVAQLNPLFREHVTFYPTQIDPSDPFKLADFCASVTTGSPEDLQAVLEERDAEARLHKSLVLLNKEREISKLQQEISRKVEEKMSETQRKYFLTEQLKSIKKELGMEKDDKEALLVKFRKKIADFGEENIPGEVLETMESELEKISTLEKNSAEFNVTRSYLDWLTSVPWGVKSKEIFDIKGAKQSLDRDHYGLDEVKDTILQLIAVGKLRGTVQGKILCLAGPPGTGKTSIAESIANALGRKFYRLSVGGLTDVSEIKGHRRTYVGAMPGKIIQCLKSTGTTNPLVLIDEIDKIGTGHRGDPASALLEVLDPSQNSTFRDHFLDVPVDISKVLFMCTANDIGNISLPLFDRMEVITLSGYDVPEKVAIAEQYLIPKAMQDSGLMIKEDIESQTESGKMLDQSVNEKNGTNEERDKQDDNYMSKLSYTLKEGIPETLALNRSAIQSLVRWYCREAGVRNLNKHIEKITRKLALQIVAEAEGTELTEKSSRKSETWAITESNLHEYVGMPIFTSDRLYETDPLPHGIVMGLAWTSMGGASLYIECQAIKRGKCPDGKVKGGGTLKVTGQLGAVMEESSQISYTVARSTLSTLCPENFYFDETDIHLHVPEGATPKDGPSAGVTMATSMLSLAMGKSIRNDLAMTGEISLTGKVLPVGGIKEKTMAARRAGIKRIIFPAGNKRDFDEMPTYLSDGLEVDFANDFSEVFRIAFD